MAKDYVTSFFKLILNHSHLHLLAIPREFLKTHGKDLSSDCISLHIPCTGATLKVKLIRSENGEEAYFSKGWPEFVELYSISIGYFIMFTYKGSSQFDVFIMDMSACEIEYPVVAVNAKPPKRVKTEKVNCIDVPAPGYSSKKVKVAAAPKKVYGFKRALTSAEKKKAEAYPTNGPSFVVKVAPTHLRSGYKMIIPGIFMRKHLNQEKKIIFINLVNEKKKTWSVKCEVKPKGNFGRQERSLTEGWRVFAKDNKLRVGDICIWELIKGHAKKTFKIGILRRTEIINQSKKCPTIKSEGENSSEDYSD